MKIPVSKPYLTQQCLDFAQDALSSRAISGLFGEYVEKFEEHFAKWVGSRYAVSCSSGTTALHLSLIAAGIKKDDEILVADLTNMATFFAVHYIGAQPIPVDINDRTYTIDLNDLQKKIKPSIKAIVIVHLFGQPVNVTDVRNIVGPKVKIIEDCAEAHGSKINNIYVGNLGDFGAFSFFGNKNLTCGEGGIVTTNCYESYEKMKNLRSLAFSKTGNKFHHESIGFNYRLSNLHCAIAFSQTLQANSLISKRISICQNYDHLLQNLEDIIIPISTQNSTNTYWMYHIRLAAPISKLRDKIMQLLANEGIETRSGFIPYSLQNKLHKLKPESIGCTNSKKCAYSTFYLPTFLEISEIEQEYISNTLQNIIKSVKKEAINGAI